MTFMLGKELLVRTREQQDHYNAIAREKAAAKAIAEGRVPGKKGQPPKNLSPEEKAAKQRARVKRYYFENHEKMKAYRAEWQRKATAEKAIADGREPGKCGPKPKHLTDESYLAVRAATRKRYYHEHREKLAAEAKDREQRKRDAIKDGTYEKTRKRLSLDEKRAKANLASHVRRAILQGVEVEQVTLADLRTMRWRQNGFCLYCNMNLGEHDIHVDHWIPLAKGGSGNKDNLCLLHGTCNLKKGARHPDEFAPAYAMAKAA